MQQRMNNRDVVQAKGIPQATRIGGQMMLSDCHLQLEALPGDLVPVEVLALDYMAGIVVVLAVQTVSEIGLFSRNNLLTYPPCCGGP